MDWVGEPFEVDFFKNVVLGSVDFFEHVFFANGVVVGDLGAEIAQQIPQQRYLGVVV